MYKPRREGTATFAQLLDAVARISPELRVRFTSPHPKDFSDEVLQVPLFTPLSKHDLLSSLSAKHKLELPFWSGCATGSTATAQCSKLCCLIARQDTR